MAQTERTFQTRVLAYLRKRGGWWSNQSPGPYSKAGIPDIIGCYLGRFYGFELKAPGRYKNAAEGASALQAMTGAQIRKAGGVWLCTDDLAEIVHALDEPNTHAEKSWQAV